MNRRPAKSSDSHGDRPQPWFWTDLSGKVYVGVRYANRWLELKPKKTAIELPTLEDLVPALKALLAAVHAGELDAVIAKAADAREAQFASRKRKSNA